MRRAPLFALLFICANAHASPPPSLPAPELTSPSLRNPSLRSPLPGGYIGGWPGDTGLDIAATFRPVYALASGTLEYSESGHTLWHTGRDTANSVRIRLDTPIPWTDAHGRSHLVTHVYYTHLSALAQVVAEGPDPRTKPHVQGGARIGVSGIGNGVPHLHLGLLLDGQVEQDSWDTLLVEGAIRAVMGGYRNGERLPEAKAAVAPQS